MQLQCLFNVTTVFRESKWQLKQFLGGFYTIEFFSSSNGEFKCHYSFNFHLELVHVFSHLLLISCHVLALLTKANDLCPGWNCQEDSRGETLPPSLLMKLLGK